MEDALSRHPCCFSDHIPLYVVIVMVIHKAVGTQHFRISYSYDQSKQHY